MSTKLDGLHIKVEDSAIPEMFAAIAATTLGVLDNFAQREMLKGRLKFAFINKMMPDLRDFFPHLSDTYDPDSNQTEAEMVSNIFFFNVMGQDDASGKFTEATYNGVTEKTEVFAKAALLNLYTKLTDLKEPTEGKEPWFSFVNEIVEIGRERFIAIVNPRMGEIVRAIKDDLGKFMDYKNTPAQNHFGNIPAIFQAQKSKMFSVKTTEGHGNIQLTLAPGKDAAGNDLLVLDADIDENGQLMAHLADLFKHKFTGGTHPFDIHEYLALDNPSRPLGYDLVQRREAAPREAVSCGPAPPHEFS